MLAAMWVLGTERGFSGKAANALTCWATSPGPQTLFWRLSSDTCKAFYQLSYCQDLSLSVLLSLLFYLNKVFPQLTSQWLLPVGVMHYEGKRSIAPTIKFHSACLTLISCRGRWARDGWDTGILIERKCLYKSLTLERRVQSMPEAMSKYSEYR